VSESEPPGPGIGRERQTAVYLSGVRGVRQRVPFAADRLELAAQKQMSAEAFAYVAGGAGAEDTVRANRAAFQRRQIVPRVLRDVSTRDLSVTLFGRRLESPLLTCPIGVLEMAHRDADLAVARAAAVEGIPMIFSNQASVSMERCAAAMGDAPRWFQLYWSTSDDLVRSFVQRAERCGCEAIVLTLDTTMLGWRVRDLDLFYLPFLRGKGLAQYTSDPVFLAALEEDPDPPEAGRPTLAALAAFGELSRAFPGRFRENLRSPLPRKPVRRFTQTYSRPSLQWSNLAFLREQTKLPILLKGVLHPDDAVQAIEHGMDGIVVSNHGGRQVDGAIASLDALPGIVDAVAGRVPVLLDSGIRNGADVIKALALGATAVCVGRPYVYGLAVAGEAGVREVLMNLVADLDLTLGLSGYASIAELGPDALASG
jgi:isopentenyl diphosphate isomerase/L-lactate dehydrogenase-like FMN-dependent dehydrogenase